MQTILIGLDTRINNYASVDLMQGYNYTLEAHITDNYKDMDLTGVTVQLQMQKPDKKFIIQTENIVIEGNKIKATLDKDFTREDGQAKLQVVLLKDNFTFGSWVVKAKIKPSAINDNDGQSDNKVTITEALVNKISEAENTKVELDKSIANGDVATIKGNVDKIKDVEIPKINSQLETKAYKSSLSVKEVCLFNEIVGVVDVTEKIQNLLNSGVNKVILEEGTFKITHLTIPNGVTLSGRGRNSVLKCCDNTTGSAIKMSPLSVIEDFKVIFGDNSQTVRGVYSINAHGSIHRNIFIQGAKGAGFRGEFPSWDMKYIDCWAEECESNGFEIYSTDTWLTNCISGINKGHGFYFTMSSIYATTCKAYLCGCDSNKQVINNNSSGFYLMPDGKTNGNHIKLTACESQENARHGYYLYNINDCILNGCQADNNSVDETALASGFHMQNIRDCIVTGTVRNRIGLAGKHYRGINVQGETFNNIIDVICKQNDRTGKDDENIYISSDSKNIELDCEIGSPLRNNIIVNNFKVGYKNKFPIEHFDYNNCYFSKSGSLASTLEINEPNNYIKINNDIIGNGGIVLTSERFNCIGGATLSIDISMKILTQSMNPSNNSVEIVISYFDSQNNYISPNTLKITPNFSSNEFKNYFILNKIIPSNATTCKIDIITTIANDKVSVYLRPPFIAMKK